LDILGTSNVILSIQRKYGFVMEQMTALISQSQTLTAPAQNQLSSWVIHNIAFSRKNILLASRLIMVQLKSGKIKIRRLIITKKLEKLKLEIQKKIRKGNYSHVMLQKEVLQEQMIQIVHLNVSIRLSLITTPY
jgi:hypothetical protein